MAYRDPALPAVGRMNWGWMLAMGVILLVSGVLAILNPFAASLAVNTIAAIAFLLVGAMQLVLALRGEEGSTNARLWAGALGVLLILFAVSLVVQPLQGLVSLTILVAALFIATGAVRVYLAFRMRHRSRWGWMLASGLVSLALGVFILVSLPVTALSLLGTILGIELIVSGCAAVALALQARTAG